MTVCLFVVVVGRIVAVFFLGGVLVCFLLLLLLFLCLFDCFVVFCC